MNERDADAIDFWRSYKESGDLEARNRLVVRYSPLVKYVAGRIRPGLPNSVDMADLLSDGVLGLMDAIESGIVKIPRVPVADDSMTGEAVMREVFARYFRGDRDGAAGRDRSGGHWNLSKKNSISVR